MDLMLIWSLSMLTIISLSIFYFLGWLAVKAVKIAESRFNYKEDDYQDALALEREKVNLLKDSLIEHQDSPLTFL